MPLNKNAIDVIDTVDVLSNIILLGIVLLQEISGKSKEEVLEMIKAEDAKTKELLSKLR